MIVYNIDDKIFGRLGAVELDTDKTEPDISAILQRYPRKG